MEKVILISIDGMRPDGFLGCGNPFIQELMAKSAHTLKGRTINPSVTLPCHMSMFHSVPAERHGISTNTYTPMVRPLNGLFEQIAMLGGISAMYYGWEPLRDVARPDSLKDAEYLNARCEADTDRKLTDAAIRRIAASDPDFTFLYLVETDEKGGHDNGWMTDAYLGYIHTAIDCVRQVWEACGNTHAILVTADHGGHDRTHGTDLPEDMTIPMFFLGKPFTPGEQLQGVSILDLAPTVADLLGVPAAEEWEGRSLLV